MADKTIKFLLVGEDKSASKTIKDVGDVAEKTGGKLGKMGEIAGGVLGGNLLTGVLSSATSAIVDFGKEAIAVSDATDKFKKTLNFAGIKADTIEALTKSTRAYADQTVYNLEDIQSVTSQLAANSVKDYDKLAEATGNLNAVAGGNVDTFKRVGSVVTQTAGAGKLTTENWNQLAEAIPGASGIIQDALKKNGAFTGNFRDAMSKGQITAEEFNDALMEIGMSDVAKEAATSTDTIEGAWGNLEATITGGLSDLITEFKPFITDSLGGAADAVGWLSDALGGLGDLLGNGNFSGSLNEAFGWQEDSAIVDFLFSVRDGFIGAEDVLKTLTSGDYTGKLEELFGWGEDSAPVDFLFDVREGFMSIWDAIQGMWAVVEPILLEVWDTIVTKWGELQPEVDEIFGGVRDIITNVMSVIQSVIQLATDLIKSIWQTWGDEILAIIGIAMDLVTGVFSGFVGIVQGVWQVLASLLKGDTQGIMDGVQQIFSGAFDVIKTVFSGAVDALGIAWSAIKSAFAEPVNWVINNVLNPLIDKIKSIAGTFGVTLSMEPINPIGYAAGGYTGPGGKYKPAGIVHADEFVVQSSSRRKFERENPGALDYLNATGMLPGYAIGGAVAGLDPVFLNALMAWSTASGYNGSVTSGYRSIAQQQALWDASDKSGKMVAAPGSSRHNFGTAADVSPYPTAAQAAMMAAFGIGLPMSYEPWHIQLGGYGSGAFGGSALDIGALLKTLVGDLFNFAVPGGGVMVDIMKAIPGKVLDWGGEWLKGKLGFDSGGWLPPGKTLATNATGQPEAILTAGQWRDVSALASGDRATRLHPDDLRALTNALESRPVRLSIDGREIAGSVRRHDRAIR